MGKMQFEPVIGIEVHAQIKTDTKIFCNCSTLFGAPPNTNICPVCLGMPGALPVLNKKVVEYTMKMALATNCEIKHESGFARKNYFYPDLPKGYQISQYELPIAQFGYIDIAMDKYSKRIGITRIHMEEDAGKLRHDPDRPISFIDFNRAGVPLMEIVSEPDIETPEEAGNYLRELRLILRYLGICDGNMEEGSFRCDANVSIRAIGTKQFGIRTELKNLNSFKHVEGALHYEIKRQKEIIFDGGKVVQETRLWDSVENKSISMRNKEEAHDYRYFPEPDLLPLVINEDWIESVRATMPELPREKKKRFIYEYQLPLYDANILTASLATANYFEDCLKIFYAPKTVSNWIMESLMGLLNAEGKTIEQSPISSQDLTSLLGLIDKGIINAKIAKVIFEEMAKTGKAPDKIVKEKGLVQVTDVSTIEKIILKILADKAKEVAEYRSGKTKLFGFFVGQIMRETKGKANPKIVNDVLKEKLRK